MFCHKCGYQLPDDARFCQKCGTRVLHMGTDEVVKPSSLPANNIPSDNAPKKKSRKLPIVLGVAGLVVFIFIIAVLFSGLHDNNNYDSMIELTKTFTSEADDISFRYPKAWSIGNNDNESIVVQLGNLDIYSFIYVWKFTEMPTVADNLYDMDDRYFIENFVTENYDDVESSSIVNLSGVYAREIYYSAPDSNVGTVYYRTYFYTIDSVMYRIDLVKKENNPIDVDTVFDAIMDSYTITAEASVDSNVNDSVLPDNTSLVGDDDIMKGYQEPLENYYELSGFYGGSTEQSTLSISIYSSQEEGEVEIGNAEIYVKGDYYFGYIIPLEKDVFGVFTDTGEEIVLVKTVFNDIIVLQLYMNNQYIEEYWMQEHYES